LTAPEPDEVIRRHAGRLLAVPGVVGLAEGTMGDRACVLVLVTSRTPEVAAGIPQLLEGLPTLIVETGTPEAFERR
jgi:hypothetical protein